MLNLTRLRREPFLLLPVVHSVPLLGTDSALHLHGRTTVQSSAADVMALRTRALSLPDGTAFDCGGRCQMVGFPQSKAVAHTRSGQPRDYRTQMGEPHAMPSSA